LCSPANVTLLNGEQVLGNSILQQNGGNDRQNGLFLLVFNNVEDKILIFCAPLQEKDVYLQAEKVK